MMDITMTLVTCTWLPVSLLYTVADDAVQLLLVMEATTQIC